MTNRSVLAGFTLILLLVWTWGTPALALEKKDKPPRGIVVAMQYPGITLGSQDKVRVDLLVKNTGQSDETILFKVTGKPEAWVAEIKGFGHLVSGVFVPEGEQRTMTFTARPEGDEQKLPPGEFHFTVQAKTQDGAVTKSTSLDLTVVEEEKMPEAVRLTTSYPVLRGPSDSKFEFSMDVANESDEDTLFNLSTLAPDNWEIFFRPAYEQKQISSIRVKAGQSSSVNVQVTPAVDAEAGEYPIKVKVRSGSTEAEADLMVSLTGTYKIKTGTLNGLLSLGTRKGKPANISVYVRNEGSASQRSISFLSFKPENWEITFKPETIENLAPGDMKQVEVVVTPAEQSLIGDYSVAINAQGERSTSDIELRVTVKASSAWGWIGIAIILAVILGLAATFRALGRR